MNDFVKFLGRNINPNVKEVLARHSSNIRDLSVYGSEVIAWAMEKVADDEAIPPILFLRNQVEVLEAISVLIDGALIDPCKPLIRTLLETHFYLEYILEKDSRTRALCFIVWHAHQMIALATKTDGNSELFKQTKSKYKNDQYLGGKPFVSNKSELVKSNWTSLLLKYPEIEQEYSRKKNSNEKRKNPNWFSLFNGPENIETLANQLKQPVSYEGVYRLFSNNVHGTDILLGTLSKGQNGELEIAQIRDISAHCLISLCCFNYAKISFSRFVEKKIPEKQNELGVRFAKHKNYIDQISGL